MAVLLTETGASVRCITSSFVAIKLANLLLEADTEGMRHLRKHAGNRSRVACTVRRRIERGGERLWRLDDFGGLSWGAVAQALSRLARQGELQRLSKGVYYRSRMTAFGPSQPNPAALERLAAQGRSIFPAGTAAAGLLGLSTQAARRPEVATSQASLPRKLLAPETLAPPESLARICRSRRTC